MRSRTFLNVSLAILALAAVYHLGARSATAQAPGNPVVGFSINQYGGLYAVTANGDLYATSSSTGPWRRDSNIFSGGPTQVQQQSLGSVKARYR